MLEFQNCLQVSMYQHEELMGHRCMWNLSAQNSDYCIIQMAKG